MAIRATLTRFSVLGWRCRQVRLDLVKVGWQRPGHFDVAAVTVELDGDGQQRDQHDGDDGVLDVLAEELDLAEEVAERGDPDRPQQSTDDVVGDERPIAHVGDAGDDRCERAHDRDEAGEDDRLRAVALEEHVGLGDVLGFEQSRVRAIEQRRSDPLAEEVADLVAGDRRDREAYEDDRQRRHVLGELGERGLLQRRRRCQEAGEEQQRVAGQEEPEQQTGLGEDDRRHHHHGEAAGLVEPPLRFEEVQAEGEDGGQAAGW